MVLLLENPENDLAVLSLYQSPAHLDVAEVLWVWPSLPHLLLVQPLHHVHEWKESVAPLCVQQCSSWPQESCF